MLYRLVTAFVLIAALVNIASHSETTPITGAVDRAVTKAKLEGKSSVGMNAPLRMPAIMGSYDESSHFLYPVRVTALQFGSALARDRNSVVTWYKFSVDEDLSPQRSLPNTPAPPGDLAIPASLLPIAANEIVTSEVGGQLFVENVLVQYGDTRPIFLTGRKYFLLLRFSPKEAEKHFYSLAANNSTAFLIQDDGDTMIPLNPDSDSRIQADIARRFQNSFAVLRANRGVKEGETGGYDTRSQ